jgi:DNA primase
VNSQIDQVKQKTDIIPLIAERVNLTKAGKHYKGLCPFHSEKTPSFTVSPELQIYKCFGCGESGDCFTFLEKYDGMEFAEALQFLADKAGVRLEKFDSSALTQKQILKEINELAAKYYHYILTNHKAGKIALNYLLETRGISMKNIEEFNLGYAPVLPSALFDFLKKKKYSPMQIEQAGLVAYGKDRFRGRLIFPLYDHLGAVVALAGRIMPGMDPKLAKYINSPETQIYNKSATLYGLNVTKGEIKRQDKAIIVEGEVDMISSFQVGIKNIVAIKGTALTSQQVTLLSRLCTEIILALDADLAGNAAARRGITIAQNAGLSIKIMQNKDYKDPDEFARNDPNGYKKALENTIGVWDFLIDSSVKKFGTSGEGKAKISRDLVPLLSSIDDDIVKAHYGSILAGKLGVPTESVLAQLQKFQKTSQVDAPVEKKEEVSDMQFMIEEELLSIAFSSEPQILLDEEVLVLVQKKVNQKLIEKLSEFLEKETEYDISKFSKFLPPELVEKFTQLVLMGQESDYSLSDARKQIQVTLVQIKKNALQEKLNLLAKKIDTLEKQKSPELKNAQNEFAQTSAQLASLK